MATKTEITHTSKHKKVTRQTVRETSVSTSGDHSTTGETSHRDQPLPGLHNPSTGKLFLFGLVVDGVTRQFDRAHRVEA
ncbi:hypothetical protein [Sphingomonas sp. GC_Shp_4]|uniref:hypothetical protein n=1 Tax=Sphingomonas sp. GC_Shp_4 TaxID=2937382 RepID=UPI00226BA7EF|nr:hypothetical protein [Sphingomonas sp. GC_Shp_4]